ncbi:MAG: acyl-CoA dehydrogenase, partial [Solirubrobacterales bacterium]|nr:acyl-CoA dehydrogenase [Solirubrobacterales bacterium]
MATATISSFSKALALGEIHEKLVFPYPLPSSEEAAHVRELIRAFRAYAAEHIDQYEIDRKGWIEDQVFRDLGQLGIMGLYVD